MDKRLVLAIALMLVVAFLPAILFPPRQPPPDSGVPVRADSPRARSETTRRVPPPSPDTITPVPLPREVPVVRGPPGEGSAEHPQDTVIVTSPLYRYEFGTAGGQLIGAWLQEYESFAPGDSATLQLVREDSPLLTHSLIIGADTVRLTDYTFAVTPDRLEVSEDDEAVTLSGDAAGLAVRLRYRFHPGSYRFEVHGTVDGLPETGAILAIGLGAGLRSVEADTLEDYRQHAIVTKAQKTESMGFGRVRPGDTDTLSGPFEWVATKSKYFVAGVLAVHEGAIPFGGVLVTGAPRVERVATRLGAVVTLPVGRQGRLRYDVYVGPQEAQRMRAIGHDFEDVNPYGWILRPVIRPIAAVVVSILIWMHERLSLAYGWVLILFGLAIRLLLWPLNQKAMESSVRMQVVAPEIKAIQQRYKDDPQRMQREVMALYRQHGVNPLGGCLPMLLPLPVLFALFFVFANTIEFRGVPFLWLPDLSRPDPLYVIPILMGLSMYALMKIGQIGVPPNPQQKIMLYFMPVFMTVLFLRFASGLNLYYAATNLFSLPQQWLIARRRRAMQPPAQAERPGRGAGARKRR